MLKRKIGFLAGAMALLSGSACVDLDVTNPNNPDIARALASPSDVQALAESSVNSWYITSLWYDPTAFFAVTSDILTSNYGNFGMRFNNEEPRIAYSNNSAGGDRFTASSPWDRNYSTLGAANDALRAFAGGLSLATPAATEKARHLAQFSQAASLMNLALTFDKAFVVDEATDLATPPTLVPYTEVSAAATAKWDALITGLAGKNHTYEERILPLVGAQLNSGTLAKLANTMAAAQLAYMPRTAAQKSTVNWQKVLGYAEKGISSGTPIDITVQGDDESWYSLFVGYPGDVFWARVDMRVINQLDPTQCARYTGSACSKPAAATGVDERIRTDMQYRGTATSAGVLGDPGRGIWMQSPWHHRRWAAHSVSSATSFKTPVPYILAAENDLLIAEALVRTNSDLARAAELINRTRVTRGQLAPATAADGAAKLLDYIRYERMVELILTNAWDLFRMRGTDWLQAGTPRHLPIPAKELETLRLPVYTFGGPGQEM